jgi:aryl-alcohol dehydrogenase-like predicted oxidoreductase
MIERELGASGIKVSAVGFGAGALGEVQEHDAERLLRTALELGVTLIDTARSYGASEERIGRYLGADRQRVVLSTKGGYGVEGVPDWSYEVIRLGIERALRTLRTDWVDLFHLHSCPLETLERGDVVRALEDARREGKLRVAAYSGENEALGWAIRSGAFGSVQCSVNVVDQRGLRSLLPEAVARGVGVIAKRPLANAVWRYGERPQRPDEAEYWERFEALRSEVDSPDWGETALRFAAFAPGVTSVLIGTRSAEHLRSAVESLGRGPLPVEQVAQLEDAFARRGSGWDGLI